MLYLSGMYWTEMGMLAFVVRSNVILPACNIGAQRGCEVFLISIEMNQEGQYYSPSVFFFRIPHAEREAQAPVVVCGLHLMGQSACCTWTLEAIPYLESIHSSPLIPLPKFNGLVYSSLFLFWQDCAG